MVQTFSLYALVGVANLATRAALPLAGGFEPPLPGTVETGGLAGRQVGDPYGRIRLSRCSHICNSCNHRDNKTGSIDKTIKMFYSIPSEFV